MNAEPSRIKCPTRVRRYGEVLTGSREVNAMLDLVKQETGRIDSRFLEPACGNGNFLVEILDRKLAVVEQRYRKSQRDYERYAVLAVSSIYGIDILADNVAQCRERLLALFESRYGCLFKQRAKARCKDSVRFILGLNIIWGDTLAMMTGGEQPRPIVFSQWSPVNGSLLKRRDFTFSGLLAQKGQSAPAPVKCYPPAHFLELAQTGGLP